MEIRQYSKADETLLFDLLIDEGDDWIDYHGPVGRSKYIKALESSITYIAYDENLVCGYARCREDDGFGVYIYDLLVRKTHRGKQIRGRKLAYGALPMAVRPQGWRWQLKIWMKRSIF
jgi:hypothetical protein